MTINWVAALSEERFQKGDGDRKKPFHKHYGSKDYRVAHEKDFDRLVFSTPVRRLKDKTQVFPLDQHDSVRTRLTHSLEVTNMARTLAAQFCDALDLPSMRKGAERSVPALVATIAISHDMGNPPFGHQGEAAIRAWVEKVEKTLGNQIKTEKDKSLLNDYLYFDGNPQAFRLVTRLQSVETGGMNLTASTLRAMFKYPWGSSSSSVKPKRPKFGFFQSEKEIFEWCCDETGIQEGELHPLTPLMEACDDIAYSILDIEDGIKKELASPSHLMVYLHRRSRDTQVKEWVDVLQEQYEEDMQWLSDREVSGKHAEDVLSQLLRSYLVALAVSVAVPSLKDEIESGKRRVRNACLEESKCKALLSLLKEYSKEYIYTHRSVVRIELEGHRVIPYLLQVFWDAVAAREEGRANKPQEYVISRISPNYFRSYLAARKEYPEWYARLQLVCDMVCGMTDSYAMSIADEFRCLDVGTV